MPFLAPLVGVLGAIGGGSAVAGGVIAGTTALSTGLAIKAATSTPDIPAIPSPVQANADMVTASDKAAADLRKKAAAGSGGRQSTILTSPLGVTGTGSAPTQQKTLLGQ